MAFYKANDKYLATLTSGYIAGQSVIYVSAVPDNVPTIVTIGKGTAKESTYSVQDTTVNSLTGVVRLRGYSGNLDSNMPVTCLNNEEFLNQYGGAVSTPETLKLVTYATDGGSSDDYAISLEVAPTSYVEGMIFTFKANTTNTGACTLNVNTLGAKAIKTPSGEDLLTGTIVSGGLYLVIYNGTNFTLFSDVKNLLSPTITTPIINTPTINNPTTKSTTQVVAAVNATVGGTTTLDLSAASIQNITMGAGNTTIALSNVTTNQPFIISITQDSGGSRTVTWFSTIKWAGGSAPTLTTTANKRDTFGFICTGTNTYDGYVVGQNI